MLDLLRWWLVAELIGLAALPYVFRLFRFLPDRGVAFARPLGLLLTGYALWLGAFSGLLPNTPGSAAFLLLLLAAGGIWLALRDGVALLLALRERRLYLLLAEAVFLLFLAGTALLRAYEPDIAGTEKPFESAFFQGVLRSESFTPRDPWYGGEPMSYYYYGYVLLGVVTHATGTEPEVAFNLSLALTAGMTATAALGLVYNLLVGANVRRRPALLGALLAPLLLLIVSNLEGVFELLAVQGVDAERFYEAIAINGLSQPEFRPKVSEAWYPTEHWWWWRATRLGSDWNVQEFPFFSFLLGDLHAHVIVLPYSLTMLAAIVQLLRWGWSGDGSHEVSRLDGRFVLRHPWVVLALALFAGALYVTNAWDFPTALVLLGFVVLARNYTGVTRAGVRPLLEGALFLAPVAVLAVLLYVPFYIGFTAAPTQLHPTRVLLPTGIERHAVATPPFQFWVFWGPLLFPALTYLLWRARTLRVWELPSGVAVLALIPAVFPLLVWLSAVAEITSVAGLADEIEARGHLLVTWLFLLPLTVLAALVLLGEVFGRARNVPDATHVFLGAAIFTAVLLILFPEFFFINDLVIMSRHNTVFKFYYTAWLLLAVSGAAGVALLLGAWRERQPAPWAGEAGDGTNPAAGAPARRWRRVPAMPRLLWLGAGLTLLALSLVYPVTATLARTQGFTGEPTLDGLAGLRRYQPGEYEATIWLRENVEGMPVVLDAVGPEYSAGGRVSARTGLPTVVGWINHEWQERGELAPVEARVRDAEALYTTDDAALARRLLDRYGVRYVYIGTYERERFGPSAGQTLARITRPVYRNGQVQIYAVQPHGEELPVRTESLP